jgi:hypothetical protein
MSTGDCSSGPSTQLRRKQPLQLPPKQPVTIAYLLCCGAKHLYVDDRLTATELNRPSRQQE